MVAHDDDLVRIAGVTKKVSELDAAELMSLPLKHGGRLISLEQALTDFPTAKFNLDIKSENAIAGTIDVIQRLGAQDRVLISSFSENRRMAALAGLTGVATSASATGLLSVWFAWRFGAKRRLGELLSDVDALQLPTHRGPIRFDSVNFIKEVRKHGVELHFWTVNDPMLARVLRARGANGLVSDRIDNIIVALAE
jgi:glycerophosphoryl diester phosphodiesterase